MQTNGVSKPISVLLMFEVLTYIVLVGLVLNHFDGMGPSIACCVRVTFDVILILVLALGISK